MDKELSLIKECPNDECDHFNKHSKMCYSCGWIEARQHYTQAKVAQKIKREIKQYAGEACFDGSGDGCKYYMIYTKWWELFWEQYDSQIQPPV